MSLIYDKNFKVLKERSPKAAAYLETFSFKEDIQIGKARVGGLFTIRNGISLNSRYDPRKEAQTATYKFISDNKDIKSVLILGGGLFYHVDELCKYFDNIFVYEADTELFQALLQSEDITSVLDKAEIILDGVFPEIEGEFVTYKHIPSIRFDEEKYSLFEAGQIYSDEPEELNTSLKILLAGPIYGGSLPVFYYCKKALENLGFEVVSLDFSIYRQVYDELDGFSENPGIRKELMGRFISLLAETIFAKTVDEDIDLVLGIAQSPFTPDLLNRLKQHGVVTSFWFVEDFRTLTYWGGLAKYFDHFFVIQKEDFFKELKKVGCKNYHYLPMAASPEFHKKMELSEADYEEFSSDVSFVGAGYFNRIHSFQSLMGFDFKIWGNDWNIDSPLLRVIQRNGERITTDEMLKVFSASKININLHSSSYVKGVNPDGDFVNPRTFELAMSGNFQLVDKRKLLPELFDENELATFDSVDEMIEKTKYFLAHPDEAIKYVTRAKERALKDHTYESRLKQMIQLILKYEPKLRVKKGSKGNKEEILKLAKESGNPDLLKVIEEVEEDTINLDNIMKSLSSKNRELNRTEAIFVLMNEFKRLAKRKKII